MRASVFASILLACALVVVAAATTGCRRKATPSSASRGPTTTSADIWLANLDGQIAELERIVKAKPEITANLQRLSALHHVRGRFRDDLDEIQQGIDLATSCIEREPDAPTCRLMRAEQEQSLHRFAQARADLARAKELGGDAARAADLEADLDWNDGRYDAAIAAIRRARRERPSTATWLREAQLDHDLGDEAAADAAFDAAERAVSDTSPLPVAHLEVQRGIVLVARGRLDDAVSWFRAAAARMPTYIAANEHLAETLHVLGKDDESVALYEKVVALSDDPEFSHALAALYAARGKKADADALEAKARARYEALLVKYPEAMYWHASEFFLGVGDARRALELLEKNVALRPNSASYVALAKAQLANGRVVEAKASIDAALRMPVRSAALFATASAVYRKSGDATAADAFRDRARAIDPHVAID